jgi:cytochrome c peroxidase
MKKNTKDRGSGVSRGRGAGRSTAVAALVAMTTLSILSSGRALSHEGGHAPPQFDYGGDSPPTQALLPAFNRAGVLATINVNGRTDPKNAFFQALGSNGRSCATCHVPSQAMSISPPAVRARFKRTNGRDPLFAPVDGANCPNARRNDRAAHSLVLQYGLIRVAQTLPADAQFTISVVHDPYGCALGNDAKTGRPVVSVYRRPLPGTNLGFLSSVMWDGRQTPAPLDDGATFLDNLKTDLTQQALAAVTGHGETTVVPTSKQLAEIVDFELGLYTAQLLDFRAGLLTGHRVRGGPWDLSEELYYPGINDTFGADPSGTAFTSIGMSSFESWAHASSAARRDIAAGEELFNTAPLTIAAVPGLNDNAALGKPASIKGTCTSCHNAPNVGNHSLPLPLDIGIGHTTFAGLETDPNIAAGLAKLDEPDLPVFLISGCATPVYTTDPGKALISGRCADLNRLKGPVLRGLAGRAPYFHNGAGGTLKQVVDFYDQRFQMALTEKQKAQLVAFLDAL